MSHENSKARAGVLPEKPGLPTIFHTTQYHDVELVSGNVRTTDGPVSSCFRSTSGHLVTSGTIPLEAYGFTMGSTIIKPQARYANTAENSQTVGGLPLDQHQSITQHTPPQQSPEKSFHWTTHRIHHTQHLNRTVFESFKKYFSAANDDTGRQTVTMIPLLNHSSIPRCLHPVHKTKSHNKQHMECNARSYHSQHNTLT